MSNIDGAAPYWTSYAYTDGGQRKTETQHTSSGDKTTTYTYDHTTADAKPHTLDKTRGARAGSYGYDSSGNTTSRPGPSAQQALAWNAEGDLSKLTESTKETRLTRQLKTAMRQSWLVFWIRESIRMKLVAE